MVIDALIKTMKSTLTGQISHAMLRIPIIGDRGMPG